MKISIKPAKPKATFGSIQIGDCFVHDSTLFLKVSSCRHQENSYAIGGDRCASLDYDKEVTPVTSIQAEV